MKKIILTVLLVASFATVISAKSPRKACVHLCSYNIRGDLPRDTATVNAWSLRKDSLCKLVSEYDFDIIAMQEVKANQLEYIHKALGYEYVGSKGLFNPIFYNQDRFELLHTETFWLSDTMEPFSKGWDAKYDRYCTWAKFRVRKTNTEFFVFNTHLDHRGEIAREQGAELLCKQVETIAAGYPVFVCGDMNSNDKSGAYLIFTKHFHDARNVASIVDGPEGTAHNFGRIKPVRIDYIFVNSMVAVRKYGADAESYPDGMFPSDHYPVFVETLLK